MIGMRKTTRNNTEKGSMNSQPVVASCRLLRVRFASLGAGNGAWSNSAMVVLQGWVSAESALTHGRHSLLSNGEVEILHRPNDRLLRRGEDVGYRGRSRGSVRCGLVHLRQGGETGAKPKSGLRFSVASASSPRTSWPPNWRSIFSLVFGVSVVAATTSPCDARSSIWVLNQLLNSIASAGCSQLFITATPEPPSGPVISPAPKSGSCATRHCPSASDPSRESRRKPASQAAPTWPMSLPSVRALSNASPHRSVVIVCSSSMRCCQNSATACEPGPSASTCHSSPSVVNQTSPAAAACPESQLCASSGVKAVMNLSSSAAIAEDSVRSSRVVGTSIPSSSNSASL